MKPSLSTVLLLAALIAAAGQGCRKNGGAGAAGSGDTIATSPGQTGGLAAAEEAADLNEPRTAQSRLPTMQLWLGAEVLNTELAVTWDQQRTGMMFRTNMPENEAMLFVFRGPHRASFWMKNTILPLSAAYIDPDGAILEIHDLQPQDTNAVTAASDQVQFVLETPQGWFRRHNVGTNTVIRTERGSLQDTFFRAK